MRYFISLLLLVLIIFSSCRPSTRFSAAKVNDHEPASRDRKSATESPELNSFVKQWIHTPYKYGGMSRSGVDCSGFSSIVMREIYDIKISRTAEEQYNNGDKIRDSWRSAGDLVFFKNFRGPGIDHVGIYLGDNRFAHASESNGVVVSDLDENYYRKRYVGSCRYQK
jgi:cell wall-associated NlpC family hydrolase